MFFVPWQYKRQKKVESLFFIIINSTFSLPGPSVWPWLGQAAGHTSLMLFLPTFIIIIHRLNDKAEIKYEIKVGNNLNNIVQYNCIKYRARMLAFAIREAEDKSQ